MDVTKMIQPMEYREHIENLFKSGQSTFTLLAIQLGLNENFSVDSLASLWSKYPTDCVGTSDYKTYVYSIPNTSISVTVCYESTDSTETRWYYRFFDNEANCVFTKTYGSRCNATSIKLLITAIRYYIKLGLVKN